jgi:hypothetical protein
MDAYRCTKSLRKCRQFFSEPDLPRQRMYEALRAYFLEGKPSVEVARAFGYTVGSFRVLCHQFRRDAKPNFFLSTQRGPRHQPKKSAARERIIVLRKQNRSIYEISEALKEDGFRLGPTAVREVLKEEGFAALPRRLDEERNDYPRPTVEDVADVRSFSLEPRKFTTQCGGLFLFVPDLVRLDIDGMASQAGFPGSQMIPAENALRSCLALKLWSVERRRHVMPLVADEGLALFSGLNRIPKKSFLSEYSSRITTQETSKALAAWHERVAEDKLFGGESFNLDFHSVPYYGEDPIVEKHYVSMRSRRQPSVLAFLAQDAAGQAFCYSNADIRKGEEADEVLRFAEFWKKHHGNYPRHLVFDSKLTTQANLARLDDLGIEFTTLRRRSPKLLKEIANLPPSAWRKVELDVPTRKYRTPRVFEQTVTLAKKQFRQLYILDLGHDEATILVTNQVKQSLAALITRYAQRMLIENALSDAVRFFHMNALCSTVGMKVDYDMALLVIASGLYRLLARRMRGYGDAQARKIFLDLLQIPANVTITNTEIKVEFHRRAHLPLILASGLTDTPTAVPWWGGRNLRLTTFRGGER